MRLKARGRRRVPPARPRLEQRYVERAIYLAFCGSHLADLGCSAQDIAVQLGHTDGGALAQELYIHTYLDRVRDRLRAVYKQNVRELRAVPRWKEETG
jgi:hypothetical protein